MDALTQRALVRALIAFTAVLVLGSTGIYVVGVLREQGTTDALPTPTPTVSIEPTAGPQTDAWLTWIPGGLPEGFGSQLTTVPAVGDVTVATADVAWMTGSVSPAGAPVDQPPDPFMIPIDTTGFEPAFAGFVPQPERTRVSGLGEDEGILSETAANLRGLDAGSTMTFDTGVIVTVAGTLPDHMMGGYELLVTRTTGVRIGVERERYALFHLKPNAVVQPDRLASLFLPYVPPRSPYGVVEVRAPGETRYLRANDHELPPALLKARFDEFTAYPDPNEPGALTIDPVWIEEHITTEDVPVFGTLTCHRKVLGYLRQVVEELPPGEVEELVRQVGACFEPLASPDDPSGPLTARPFGAVIDLNAATNRPGEPPDQPFPLLRAMYRGGFGWGGRDAYPQGSRFRYVHAPQRG